MFYKNLSKFNKKVKYKEYTPIPFSVGWKDDNDDRFGACDKVYNFDYNGDALTDCCGVGKFRTSCTIDPEDTLNRDFVFDDRKIIVRCFYKRMLRQYPNGYWSLFMFYDNYDKFYYYVINSSNSTPVNVPELDTQYFNGLYTTYVNGVENILVSRMGSNTIPMWQPNVISTIKYLDDSCRYKSMCYFDNRTFATTSFPDNTTVFYSEEFNPTNFRISNKDTGSVIFEDDLGKCEYLLEFNDAVYVFRELGISKIVKSRDKVSYEGENIYKASGRIFKDTVCVCGDKILFFASNGLYEFNGKTVKKINLGYENKLSIRLNYYPKASYLDGVYYLNTIIDYGEKDKVLADPFSYEEYNTLIKYNVNKGTSTICRGFRIRSFAPVLDDYNCAMVAVFDGAAGLGFGVLNNCGTINDAPIKKLWRSKKYDFGNSTKYKFIKEIRLKTRSDITLKLNIDGKEISIKVKGKDSVQAIKINKKAKILSYGFEAFYGGNYISDIRFLVGEYGE